MDNLSLNSKIERERERDFICNFFQAVEIRSGGGRKYRRKLERERL